ncbi:brain-specific angiogenesis inhibitor 1-associated protein 2-like protein 2 [Chanos chanos]|uniref:Brain-specific angiogenesis inhibitor 1-associated protein 2-like protein 2 n=1 Tax=Chanos chanos TaxID=29144 RepID=A0A6J2WY32_CHACN|nr:brain-specific angiogenesis inhibitor 1-associated protein 2-like protein 2 [Chanos chanos]
MSGLNTDQVHRSTLGIYTNILDQFNPSLQRLVALGNSYIQAFQALALSSEAYFNALAKIGEQAQQTKSSRSLGDVLIQISQSQRRLTSELEGMFRWFNNEILQMMDSNVRLDKDYIAGSRRQYEMEVRNQATALERQLGRGGPPDNGEYMQFLKFSQNEALKEEERRYRFLAEKHCRLTQTIALLMNRTGGTLQQRAEEWGNQVNETRASGPRTPSRLEEPMADVRGYQWGNRDEPQLGRVPSRAPSPQPSRSRSSSFGESLGGAKSMRALVAHPPSTNSTLLPFSRGDNITLLVPQPRNGWFYGRAESTGRQGWFPAAYVGPIEEPQEPPGPSSSSLRTSHSMSDLLDHQSTARKQSAAPPPPAPPTTRSTNSRQMTPTPSQNRRQEDYGQRPQLFPRGTNPFATVKLRPTQTNDRSAPRIF